MLDPCIGRALDCPMRLFSVLFIVSLLATGCEFLLTDRDHDGYDEPEDCDDSNPQVHPGLDEICDGIDQDCDGEIDDGVLPTWYRDVDADGRGDPEFTLEECEQPAGFVDVGGDCDDFDAHVHPDAAEVCDERDNDCDGEVDEADAEDARTWYTDADLDTYGDPDDSFVACTSHPGYVAEGGDCDDGDPAIHPGVAETCDDVDQDCDGVIDDDPIDGDPWYVDADGDGYGDASVWVMACEQPDGYAAEDTDCDDTESAISPGAPEFCDGIDNDCDGAIDVGADDAYPHYEDADGDGQGNGAVIEYLCESVPGWVEDANDCDDTDDTVHVGAPELCDGQDNDCDAGTDETMDGDGDGFSVCAGDCDDLDIGISPIATEVCNGIDDDCDGIDDDECLDCDLWVPTDHTEIQAAIDAATGGEVICVQPGEYAERLDFGGKDLHLLGAAGAAWTIVDGGAQGSVVTFASAEGTDAILEGFTLRNGYAYYGGGVVADGASPTLRNLIVTGCNALYDGGGIFVSGAVTGFEDLHLESNHALGGSGGGLYVEDSWLTLDRVDLYYNTSTDTGGGLTATLLSGPLALSHGWFVSNYAYAGGGGLAALDNGFDVLLDDVVLTANTTDLVGGGGLLCDDAPSQLTNVWLSSNVAPTGGGAFVQDAATQMVNVVVADNEERGLDLRSNGSSPALSNMAIVANRSGQPGGGLYVYGVDPMLTNVDISMNSSFGGGAVHAVAASPILGHCNVYDNTPADFSGMGNPVGTDGNISVDPGYLDTTAADALGWDLHLDVASALVDAGDGNLADPGGSACDIGALGGVMADQWDLDGDGSPGWWMPGPYDTLLYPAQGWDCDDLDATVGPDSGC